MSRKKPSTRKSSGKVFFNDSNFLGIYRTIFSFVPSNVEVFSLGVTCKNMWICLYQMMTRSSVRLYRLLRMNNKDEIQPDFTFNVFGGGNQRPEPYVLDKDLYVSSLDEYERGFKNNLFFEIIGEINKKHGPVAMISGGYALKHFYRGSSFPHKFRQMSTCPQDIDIFLLGKKKKEIVVEILAEMKKRFKNPRKFVIFYSTDLGLINVEVRSEYFSQCPEIPEDIKSSVKIIDSFHEYPDDKKEGHYHRRERERDYYDDSDEDEYDEEEWGDLDLETFNKHKRTRNVFQFILKKIHMTPSDVFSFFDLDLCKLGYFPGLKKLVCPIAFIRSLVTRINYVDLDGDHASYKHYHRIRRYYGRTKIMTSLECEPLLSYYHTFKSPVDYKKFPRIIYPWRVPSVFGDRSRHGWYYYKNRNTAQYRNSEGVQLRKGQVREFRNLKAFRKRLPKKFVRHDKSKDEVKHIPYLCESVGMIRKEDNKYVYRKRKPTSSYYLPVVVRRVRTARTPKQPYGGFRDVREIRGAHVLGKDVFKESEYELYPKRVI